MVDHEVAPARVREFLANPRHHIVVALDEDLVVGFASGVHYIHPGGLAAKSSKDCWVRWEASARRPIR